MTYALDLNNIGDDDRYKILEYVVGRYGRDKVQKALGVSRIILW